jgi:uncharacterized protein YkwD
MALLTAPGRTFRRKAIAALLPLLVLFCLMLVTAAANAQQRTYDAAGEAQLVNLINQARAQQGLSPLVVDNRLTEAARKHTELMVQHQALSHQFEGEPPMQTRFSNEGLPSDREGENVDLDQDIASAHQALMHSPPHRANILDPNYNVVGVGVIRRGENLYITEDFARRLPEYSEPQAEAALQHAIEQYAKSRGLPAPVRKPQPQLRRIACDMALNDALEDQTAARLPGVHEVFVWTTGNPAKLPAGIAKILSSGLPAGYSLGACFAPSVSYPGGVYWVVMVSY